MIHRHEMTLEWIDRPLYVISFFFKLITGYRLFANLRLCDNLRTDWKLWFCVKISVRVIGGAAQLSEPGLN